MLGFCISLINGQKMERSWVGSRGTSCLGARKLSRCRILIAGRCACLGAYTITKLSWEQEHLPDCPVRLASARRAPAWPMAIRTGRQAGKAKSFPLFSQKSGKQLTHSTYDKSIVRVIFRQVLKLSQLRNLSRWTELSRFCFLFWSLKRSLSQMLRRMMNC